MATQDDLKRMTGEKAVEFVPENEYIVVEVCWQIIYGDLLW